VNSEDRARLGRIWIETALGEHASVAAFARFVLHLLSLGSPPDLILDAIKAMEDEVHHARLCFGIARQFTDEAPGPGRMDLSGVLEESDEPDAILRAAIREGCIEETISAAHAQVAVERATEPGMHAALARIADDEARHADLAWRFVRWALQAYPELTSSAEECFATALATPYEPDDRDDSPLLEPHGLLLSDSKSQVRQETLREKIIPRVVELFGRFPIANAPETIS